MISLLHPTRNRPDKSRDTTNKWISHANTAIELIVSVDEDDPQLEKYKEYYSGVRLLVRKNRSAIDAINAAAEASSGSILVVVSDDSDCPRNWGNKIIDATANKKDWIMKVNDGIQRWVITMPIMDRIYYNRFGYIYYPDYLHMFCDTEVSHVADLLKRRITRDDFSFPHRHYSVTRTGKDTTSQKADSTWEQGKQLYLRRAKESFGLKGVDIMNVSDNAHLRWLKANLK